ncbi:DUF6064 family protein [Geminicoccus flavidas]|uniref:DUF6064 family protein n=1 Tax=Geminicoccus flavidas TaxID=2506407 RepID=UPI00135B5B7D|nr:DUF6064 family protein [Geminicoccus flavidas]
MIDDLGSYALEDFLLFAPRTYFRLIELHHAAVWPAQLLAGAALVLAGVLMWRGHGLRAVVVVLAAGWLFVAWAWFWLRYATINWAAGAAALAFLVEALALLVLGLSGRLDFAGPGPGPGPGRRRAAVSLFAAACLLPILVAPLAGRSWRQADLALVLPDSTALATLAVLAGCVGWWRWLLVPVPLLWCAVAGMTLLAMGAPDAWLVPCQALLLLAGGIGLAWRDRAHLGTRQPGSAAHDGFRML